MVDAKHSPKLLYLPLIFSSLLLFMLSACGSSDSAEAVDLTANLNEVEKIGFQVYTRNCAACHLLTEGDVKVGPSLYNVANTAGQRVADQDAKTYLYTSILVVQHATTGC